jgi:hypothetical protein
MPLLRRAVTLALGCALVLPALPATAAGPWYDPQTIVTTPASEPATAVAETADGTLVGVVRDAAGDFHRSTRAPGDEWVPGGVFVDPDGFTIRYVQAVAVTGDGAGWLAYSVDGSSDVRVVRWDPNDTTEEIGVVADPWTTVDMTVDAEGDVLLTYGERGGYPLSAMYGNAVDGLDPLNVPSWTGSQRPHQWVLGPGDDVMLVSRFGSRLRTVDVGPDGDGKTRELHRPGAGLTNQVAAAIAPSGVQYVAWTTAPDGGPRTVHMARRQPGDAWLPGRVVDQRGERSQRQKSLVVRTTAGGAYLAWVQPGKHGSEIRGALVSRQRPVLAQAVAGPRVLGNFRGRLVIDVGQRGRLLVAWTQVGERGRRVAVALGQVRGHPAVTRLFGVDAVKRPVALLRAADEATVVGSSPSTTASGPVVRSASTD